MISYKLARHAALVGVGAVVGMLAGWVTWHQKVSTPETYAAAIRQPDQSLILERNPKIEAKPAQTIPKGAKIERVIKATVQPRLKPIPTVDQLTHSYGSLSPVTVDLTLVRMPDSSSRIIASSPDGFVISGIDIPAGPLKIQKIHKWQAGFSWDPGDRTYGVWSTRSVGHLVVGGHVFQDKIPVLAGGGTKLKGQILVGIRF